MRRKVTAEGEPPDLPSLASVERVDETHLDSGDQLMGRPPKTPPPGYPARDRRAHPPLRRVNDSSCQTGLAKQKSAPQGGRWVGERKRGRASQHQELARRRVCDPSLTLVGEREGPARVVTSPLYKTISQS